jgi:hypothetical protein
MKICNADGECGFFFRTGHSNGPPGPRFSDVSASWGLGPDGFASDVKGDSLGVADLNGDSKVDFLYGAGSGMLFLNHGDKFIHRADCGINFKTGKVGPSLGDFDGDGHFDLFVPQAGGGCKLFRNIGGGKFADVTATSGDLAKPISGAVSATWGDFDNDGKPDLVVCRLRGSNRYFKNNGDGTFLEKSSELGLTQKVFNSQAAVFADLNGDGQLDLVLNNEGQESSVLFGTTGPASGKTAIVVGLNGTASLNGGRVVVKDASGKPVATCCVAGGDCRGGQCGLVPRFVLAPGSYKIEFVGSDGKSVVKDVTVASAPMSLRMQ